MKDQLSQKIRRLANERNAIIIAHNYQPSDIQDVADLCGDSLELSIKAAQTKADVIFFCGVHFMAETAYILSPDKTVLLPDIDAGCPMADMVEPEALVEKNRPLEISLLSLMSIPLLQLKQCLISAVPRPMWLKLSMPSMLMKY